MTLDPDLTILPADVWLRGYIGGTMIGIAAAIMLLGLGRIAGVSGLLARTMAISQSGMRKRVAAAFIVGLPLGGLLFELAFGPVLTRYPPSMLMLVVGGTVVGFGTRLGSGCTSGHGVCGVSRLSPRSLLATATFIGSGMLTVILMKYWELGW
ncbi:hypothetical protein SAMN02745824_0743 [Parasphingorhabdus marina DSM 22363]|uniref:Uncharacterized protein n=1 Tax=Parasphingorhabdus marina DSM 22363 TaxID=1123272 RepID=A0A1N6CQD0_9SPHN|nr:YeeE/YedE thiosulfate transporter family protein [Parasphingorhabdus marina]SIN60791.1 hypothetical protein SAMN02745824_0743 [Parasphingorhabdus marina DSM 22363]